MAYNKVVYSGNTLIDLTSDTVAADKVLNGYTAHDKSGAAITGNVAFVTYYTGSSAPSSSLGNNGDIYLRVTT